LNGIGLVVGPAQGNVSSARAKNSEIQRDYDDLKYVMKELMDRRVDTSKSTTWWWMTSNFNGRALMVDLGQGCIPLCQSKK
jgi:hypothetical protein